MRKQTKLVAVLSAAALLAIGASMTSFAATPHWDMEDNEWVYLDRNGDRVTDEWKKSNGQWYYLDENGYMARDMIIEDDDDKYYVDENGARVTNAWVSMDNDDLLDDDDEPESIDTVWMYFDSDGKALGCDTTNGEIKKLSYGDGQSGYFIFNEDGYMLSGWKEWSKSGTDDKIYYLGSQNEGWAAANTWKYLSVDKDLDIFADIDDDDDGDEFWFYFKSDGKACRSETKAIGGKTYAFDSCGRMLDLWTTGSKSSLTNATASSADKDAVFYREDNGGREKGWVQVYPNSNYDDYDDDPYWFYLNSKGEPYRATDDIAAPATRVDDDDVKDTDDPEYNKKVFVKSIKNESYLFNDKGVMLTGLYWLGGSKEGEDEKEVQKGGSTLNPGYYYFDTSDGSVEGQMVTNRKVTIEVDDEDEVYYFHKNGYAFINTVISSSIYGKNGQLYDDDGDGSTYEKVLLSDIIGEDGILHEKKGDGAKAVDTVKPTDYVMVNGNGKIKKSGTVTDSNDDKYVVEGYKVTNPDNPK